jgi:hypothetical protein
MTSNFGWRETAIVWMAGILLVSLLFALTGETVDLVWLRQPIGMIAWNVADIFGWLFAVLLIALFVLVASMDDPKNRRPGVEPFRPGHG